MTAAAWASVGPDPFANANTPAELAALQSRAGARYQAAD
jgi:hypothetical protein